MDDLMYGEELGLPIGAREDDAGALHALERIVETHEARSGDVMTGLIPADVESLTDPAQIGLGL